jgi:chemotaxis protein CheD
MTTRDNHHPNRYFDRHFKKQAVKILPGTYYATKENTMIVTVLGSCVSVCLRDPYNKISGMNHFLLPSDHSNTHPDILSDSARYGVFAMELLINEMLKLGASKSCLEAKVFGGGNVLKGLNVSNIGQRNAEFVVAYLTREQIPIVARDLEEDFARKVYFFPEDGSVQVKKLKSMNNMTIIDRESAYRNIIGKTPSSGDVDLFE